jgi:putative addiction module component (TIGR02574 family)
MSTVDELAEKALQLSFDEREDLAQRLIRSLEPPGAELQREEWAASWHSELDRRVLAYQRGQTRAVSRTEAVDAMREALRQRHGS